MMLTLYHGSKDIIERPIYGKGNPHNDYGLGFYCTTDRNMAKEWACTDRYAGYSNAYLLDDSDLEVLRLDSRQYNILHWIALLTENRTFDVSGDVARTAKRFLADNYLIDKSGYDTIIGWRADDSYFSFAQDFLDGRITVRTLSEAMKLGDLGLQYVLISERSFERLRFSGYEHAEEEIFYERRMRRDHDARARYKDIRRDGYGPGDILITHLIDGTVSMDDVRLQ